jgi:hypothetical protein
MAALSRTSDGSAITLALHGEVRRDAVDELRAALAGARSARATENPFVEVDLREVTAFPRLGIAVLVAARRWFGERLNIRGNAAVDELIDDAGLTQVVRPAA